MGNQFISSAREIYSNHALLANITDEDLLLNRDWQYINKNGPAYITAGYRQSADGMVLRCVC